jgi:hypothetical protein
VDDVDMFTVIRRENLCQISSSLRRNKSYQRLVNSDGIDLEDRLYMKSSPSTQSLSSSLQHQIIDFEGNSCEDLPSSNDVGLLEDADSESVSDVTMPLNDDDINIAKRSISQSEADLHPTSTDFDASIINENKHLLHDFWLVVQVIHPYPLCMLLYDFLIRWNNEEKMMMWPFLLPFTFVKGL